MIGWRRRAKAARESTVSPERLYELVSQTLMENFGPLGSFAITRRSAADTDDIFHTALARSVAHDIVANLAEHGITVRTNLGQADATPAAASARLAPVERVFVPRDLARAVASATTLRTAPVAVVPAAASVAEVPAASVAEVPAASAPAVPVGTAPVLDGPDPRDDDALRALVAHHAEVAEATARNHNQVRWVI